MWNGHRIRDSTALLLVVCSIVPFTESARAEPAGDVAPPGLRVHRATNDEAKAMFTADASAAVAKADKNWPTVAH